MKLKLDRKGKRELKRLLSVTQDKREYVQASPRSVDAGPEEEGDRDSEVAGRLDRRRREVAQVIQEGRHPRRQGEETIRQASAEDEARRGEDEGAPELKQDPQAFGFLKGRWVVRDIAKAL